MKIIEWIIYQWQKRCSHSGKQCFADLNQGDASPIAWCTRCGAIKRSTYWESPDAKWS